MRLNSLPSPTIKEMPEWNFWCRDFIGTADDWDQLQAGTISPERMQELSDVAEAKRKALAMMPVPGFQEWMTTRRGMN